MGYFFKEEKKRTQTWEGMGRWIWLELRSEYDQDTLHEILKELIEILYSLEIL